MSVEMLAADFFPSLLNLLTSIRHGQLEGVSGAGVRRLPVWMDLINAVKWLQDNEALLTSFACWPIYQNVPEHQRQTAATILAAVSCSQMNQFH